jgi:hypothetical protein
MTTEIVEIRSQFEQLQNKFKEFLPKVDSALIEDLLLRLSENPQEAPSYLVEIFTEPGLDTESIRQFIMTKTGQCPAIYDNGIHFAVHQRLTLEELRVISQVEGVIEVTGEYSGGLASWGASHEHK